jgi:hypothetical protein
LIEVLLAHRHLPAAAVIEGMRRTLTAKTVNPEVALVEACQAADGDSAHVVPIGVQALAHYDRPTPTSAAMTRCSTATSSGPTRH